MEIQRVKVFVEAYHFDTRHPEIEVETEINVGVTPLDDFEKTPDASTALHTRLQFRLVFDEYVLSGAVSQVNYLINRVVKEQKDISQEEVEELVSPLFEIVKRLTYEVTEIALDEPGLMLNFESSGEVVAQEKQEVSTEE